MSWIQKLHETYELCAGAPQFAKDPLLPVSHTEKQAHIEIVLDRNGSFQRAAVIAKENTVIPASEKSAGRANRRGSRHHSEPSPCAYSCPQPLARRGRAIPDVPD